MNKELELWQFIASQLKNGETVMLLIVADSSGSSPGRAGYKMAVGKDGELVGSIGGGVMEVNLVEQSRSVLSEPSAVADCSTQVKEQVHRKDVPNSSGMICSGKQTVIFRLLASEDNHAVASIIDALKIRAASFLTITTIRFSVEPSEAKTRGEDFQFEISDDKFFYRERLGPKNSLYIVGGGHCALALSELMSKMDFRIRIFDDRHELNTLDKNRFADEIELVESYEQIAEHIPSTPNSYVVVMTLGYAFDKIVIQRLLDKDFKYFGVLGSQAKMATLMKELKSEGYDENRLQRIHTPIGLPINSHAPVEIAVSIAAEIISIKNS